MTNQQHNILESAALRYADNGWHVFPLYGIVDNRCECGTNCGSPGKHPRISNGLHGATTDEGKIKAWWKRWPNANVGIASGAISGIYVIDIDNKRSVDLGNGILIGEGENSLRHQSQAIGSLPDTLTSITGSGGMHIVFQYPMDPIQMTHNGSFGNRTGILPSVDVRGDGGYIVAPPSLHQSGNRYRWIEEDQPLALLPKQWVMWLMEMGTAPSKHSLDLEIPSGFQVGEGERNDWLFRMGAKLRGQHGLPRIALWGALAGYNRMVCVPPLDAVEVERIVESCLEYEPGIATNNIAHPSVPALEEGEDLAMVLAEFLQEDVPPGVSLVTSLLHAGECMILGGPPNVGKTWVAMDMMLGIASGTSFANHFHCQPAPVLFIDEEGSKRVDHKRFSMLLEGRETHSASDYQIFTKISSGIRLDEERGRAALSRLIERYRPGAIFLDSLVRVHGGNESDNRAMAEMFRLVRQLMETYQTSFIFTHHIRKPSKDASDDPIWMLRGASDIQGFPDSIIVALPTEDSTEVKVIHSKMRDGQKLDPFLLRIVADEEAGTATVAHKSLDGHVSGTRQLLQDILRQTPHTTAEQIAYKSGLGLATVKDHLQVLEVSGAIRSRREANTKYYQPAI